ncbi:MAG: class I SAM-dependent methyltransferase [Vulcanimicrobiaceae bacterium]
MEARKEREREFHDRRFAAGGHRPASDFYSVAGASREAYLRSINEFAKPGLRILEYGCGRGSMAFDLAAAGASVSGIDISPVAIEIAQGEAGSRDCPPIDFQVMDAEHLAFPDASFDLVCGAGILHHLDLERAYAEVRRVLRPGGIAVFGEPLGHNALINVYRRRTPEQRTADEHPLLMRDFALARRYFGRVDVSYFHLATLAAIPFRNKRGAKTAVTVLDALDRAVFRLIPAARRFAWIVVVVLSDSPQAAPT